MKGNGVLMESRNHSMNSNKIQNSQRLDIRKKI